MCFEEKESTVWKIWLWFSYWFFYRLLHLPLWVPAQINRVLFRIIFCWTGVHRWREHYSHRDNWTIGLSTGSKECYSKLMKECYVCGKEVLITRRVGLIRKDGKKSLNEQTMFED